jgi:cytochrome oxidase Cu insertion factor (SCO1/SenC/PrrC family)
MFGKNASIGASLALVLTAGLSVSARAAEVPIGKPAPAFTLKQLDGKPLALSALKGKVVLLNFWGPA